jgi:hypothetical protein
MNVTLLHEQHCKMGRTGVIKAQVRATKLRRKFSQRTNSIHPIGPQSHVLGRFEPFHYCTNLGAKGAELEHLMHKFVQRSRVGIFCNKRTRSTPLDPQTHVLGHFRTLRYRTNFDTKWAKLVQLVRKFVERSRFRTFRNERTRSNPLDPKLIFWDVLNRFITARTWVQNRLNWSTWCTSLCNEVM